MQKLAPKVVQLLTVGALSAALTGCVENNSSIFIHSIDADASQTCTCSGDAQGPSLFSGVIDRVQRPGAGYIAGVRFGNQMVRSGNNSRLRVEASHVTIYEAEVEVFDAAGSSLVSFSQPVSGFAFAGTGNNPGFGCTFLTLIDAQTVGAIAAPQTVVSRIKLFGETTGGNDVETGIFDYPIDVCDGCLGCIDVQDADACSDAPEVVNCRIGQDFASDCRCVSSGQTDNAGNLLSASGTCGGQFASCSVVPE